LEENKLKRVHKKAVVTQCISIAFVLNVTSRKSTKKQTKTPNDWGENGRKTLASPLPTSLNKLGKMSGS